MKLGPVTTDQMRRLASEWKQGEHVLISGATGSGKTALGRHVDEIRIERGGHVVVLICKLKPDQTILDDYKGWTRWKEWKKRPSAHENKILLWPDTKKATLREALEIQKNVFGEAFDELGKVGKWTVDIDEGLYTSNPQFLNFGQELAMLHAIGRSSNLTLITKVQRPSHIPLIIYSSASHAFIGRTQEQTDLKRLSELGGRTSAKELAARISAQGRHDFLWVPVAPDWEPETVNLKK